MAQELTEVEEAIRAYWRLRRRQGFDDCQIPQPSRYSEVHDGKVTLTNSRGYLATYHLNSRRVTYSRREDRRVARELNA